MTGLYVDLGHSVDPWGDLGVGPTGSTVDQPELVAILQGLGWNREAGTPSVIEGPETLTSATLERTANGHILLADVLSTVQRPFDLLQLLRSYGAHEVVVLTRNPAYRELHEAFPEGDAVIYSWTEASLAHLLRRFFEHAECDAIVGGRWILGRAWRNRFPTTNEAAPL